MGVRTVSKRELLRQAAGTLLVVAGLGGTVAALLGVETVSPWLFAVSIAAGADTLGGDADGRCSLCSRLSR